MVRDALLTSRLYFLDCVIQEEVDQDGVDFGFWVVSLNLPPNQLDAPNAAGCSHHYS